MWNENRPQKWMDTKPSVIAICMEDQRNGRMGGTEVNEWNAVEAYVERELK